jgi:hypothetical protein
MQPQRDPFIRVACPRCRGVDSARYWQRLGRVYCGCGWSAGVEEFEAEVDRQTRVYFDEFPGLTDGSSFQAAKQLTARLLQHAVEPHLAEGLVRAWNAACARPPLAAWQLDQAIDLVATAELRRRRSEAP